MTDQQIIEALISRDKRVTEQFFYGSCRPLFLSIIRNIFSHEVDYDEFVNEFYLYLMENDSYRLRQFKGRSTIYQWLKIIAIRYFLAKREKMIDNQSEEALIDKASKSIPIDTENPLTAKVDIEHLLKMLPNRRYEYVIRRLVLQDAEPKKVAKELCTNTDNLYNIKKRAIAALTELALDEIEKYGKKGN